MRKEPEPITLRVFIIGIACMAAGGFLGSLVLPVCIGTYDGGDWIWEFTFFDPCSAIFICVGGSMGLSFGCAAMKKWLPECREPDTPADSVDLREQFEEDPW